jgi:hypothetical protein
MPEQSQIDKLIDNFARVVEQRDKLLTEKESLLHGLIELELRTRQYFEGSIVAFPSALLPQVRSLIESLNV